MFDSQLFWAGSLATDAKRKDLRAGRNDVRCCNFRAQYPSAIPLKSVFYSIMPESFLYVGIAIATAAAIIASQALISGSFTLVSEALRLNLWPKMKLNYPTEEKGQLFIPGINTLLFIGCAGITIYFQTASHMEAAYGLAITLCMISTSIVVCQLSRKQARQQWLDLPVSRGVSYIGDRLSDCQP